MDGLQLLGAADALADQYITLRIKSIDREKLKSKLGGMTGSLATSALSFADMGPKAAVDVVLPLAKSQAKNYGVDLETTVSNVPLSKGGRAISEFWPGLLVGTVLGGSVLLIGKTISALSHRLMHA